MLLVSQAAAQNSGMYLFKFQGLSYTTNAAGRIRSTRVTERTLLQDKASAANITDVSGMSVVYHVAGSGFGDTIDIVNTSTGQVLDTLLGLYFSQAFSRVGITNALDTEERRIDYLYTDQDAHSMGAASVRRTYTTVGRGTNATQRLMVQGRMDWVKAIDAAQGGSKLYSGNFFTGAAFVPKH